MLKLPSKFEEQMNVLLQGEAERFFSSLQAPSPVSIRINPAKTWSLVSPKPVAWGESGYYLEERPVFTLDPLFHAGSYYVQEASSMFMEEIIRQLGLAEKELRALDLCAAPGGKTTHLLSSLHKDALVVSNEIIRSRVKILEENIIKWGHGNCVITNNEALDFAVLKNYFDLILCDAPCSGEGMFRKDNEAVQHWSEEAVQFCSQRQKKIIADVLPALKPSGYFIYSTCTFNAVENENVADWMREEFGMKVVDIKTEKFPGLIKNSGTGTIHFYPHKVAGEGFTVTVLQKEEADLSPGRPVTNKLKEVKADGVLKDTDNFFFFEMEGKITGIKRNHVNGIALLLQSLKVVHAGTEIYTLKGKDKIPSHQLAMSINLQKDQFNTIELDRQQALKYLKGETHFNIEGDNGYYLVTFSGEPLGFLKKIGLRCNNLYPRHLFIRMQIS